MIRATGDYNRRSRGCCSPRCNNSIPDAVRRCTLYPAGCSQNVVTASVSGAAATMVYAASTNSKTVIPISTANNVPRNTGTLPNLPNSALMDPTGSVLYLGSSAGLMAVSLATNTVTSYSVNGTVVAIPPDSRYLLISDSVGNAVYYFDTNTSTILYQCRLHNQLEPIPRMAEVQRVGEQH